MTVGHTQQAFENVQQMTAVSTPCITPPARSRTPVVEILPATLTDEIRTIVRALPSVTAKLAKDVDGRFDIESRFGVSKRRLRNYLQRLHDNCKPGPSSETKPSIAPRLPVDGQSSSATQDNGRVARAAAPAESGPAEGDKLRAHRMRQASIASILDATFGPPADCNPELWDRRAYLMLVGMVYDRLTFSEDDLPAKELVALAKGLAEARRADARAREHELDKESKDSPSATAAHLPENFAEIVRQVYGTNFHAPTEGRDEIRMANGE